jgi:hypothetical protein
MASMGTRHAPPPVGRFRAAARPPTRGAYAPPGGPPHVPHPGGVRLAVAGLDEVQLDEVRLDAVARVERIDHRLDELDALAGLDELDEVGARLDEGDELDHRLERDEGSSMGSTTATRATSSTR